MNSNIKIDKAVCMVGKTIQEYFIFKQNPVAIVGHNPTAIDQFACWCYYPDGKVFWGKYGTLEAANAEYDERAGYAI